MPISKQKKKIAREGNFKVNEFKASNRLLDRWNSGKKVTFERVSGGSKSYSTVITVHWKETDVPTIFPGMN